MALVSASCTLYSKCRIWFFWVSRILCVWFIVTFIGTAHLTLYNWCLYFGILSIPFSIPVHNLLATRSLRSWRNMKEMVWFFWHARAWLAFYKFIPSLVTNGMNDISVGCAFGIGLLHMKCVFLISLTCTQSEGTTDQLLWSRVNATILTWINGLWSCLWTSAEQDQEWLSWTDTFMSWVSLLFRSSSLLS